VLNISSRPVSKWSNSGESTMTKERRRQMKKILGILVMAAVMSSPAWASENVTLKIDDNGASFLYVGEGGRAGAGPYEIARIRPRGGAALWGRRVAEVDRRLDRQMARIRAGRKEGDLTRREQGRLQADNRQIRSYFYTAIGDGRLSSREWRNLTVMLDRASESIYRLRHNRRQAIHDNTVRSPENRWRFNRRLYR
jgi:hypothetical protein